MTATFQSCLYSAEGKRRSSESTLHWDSLASGPEIWCFRPREQLFQVRALPPEGRGGGGARQEGATGPAFGAPMAPRAPRPDADVSFPSHYTSRHHCLRLPRKSRPIVCPSPQISSFSASWSSPPFLEPRGGASRTACLLAWGPAGSGR